MQLLCDILQLPLTQAFILIVGTLIFGLTIPLWFWHFPPFHEIRRIKEAIEADEFSINYVGGVREFAALLRPTSRIALYWSSRTAERIVSCHIEDLSGLFVVFAVGQTILLIIISLGKWPELPSALHILIHYPVAETSILIVFFYISWKTGREWRQIREEWFRRDAWD